MALHRAKYGLCIKSRVAIEGKALGSGASEFQRFLFDKSLVRYPGKGLK